MHACCASQVVLGVVGSLKEEGKEREREGREREREREREGERKREREGTFQCDIQIFGCSPYIYIDTHVHVQNT